MKNKTPYCTLVFYLKKNTNPLVDSAAKVISFDKDCITVESRFLYINKDLIESISITMIECTNMQVAMNASVKSVEKINNVARYTLNNNEEKIFELKGKQFSVQNQSLLKKLNIARINN